MHSRTQTGRRSSRLVLVVVCLAVVVLGGCLARPPNHSEVVEKSLPKGTSIPSSWSSSGGANAAVSDNWLESFHDPGLDAVVEEAIKNNLDLQQAAAKVTIARQTVVIVGSQLKPHVGAQFSDAATQTTDPSSTFKSNMEYGGASWEVDVWGRLRSQQVRRPCEFRSSCARLFVCPAIPSGHHGEKLVSDDRKPPTPGAR